MLTLLLFLWAYFVGAMPFGVWIASASGIDITKHGSGNIGATNVFRVVGRTAAAAVFLLDVAKGFIPTFIAVKLLGGSGTPEEIPVLIGVTAVVGHTFSPALGFRGGKGVATALGFLVAATPLVAAIGFGVFVVCLAVCRWVSLASMLAAASLPVSALVFGHGIQIVAILFALAVYTLFRHRANIGRMLAGTEPKVGITKRP